MTRWLALLLPALAGCIVYDTEGKCWDCAPDEDRPDGNDGGLEGDDTGDDPSVPPQDYKFVLDPAEAHQGDTFIAHLTQSGSFDLSQVNGAEFIDGVPEVVAFEPGEDEVLLTVHVPADAALGAVSLLLHTTDDGNEYVPEVLTILEADNGQGGGDDTGGCP